MRVSIIYFIYLKSMSYTKYTYKKENVQKQAPLNKHIQAHKFKKKLKTTYVINKLSYFMFH